VLCQTGVHHTLTWPRAALIASFMAIVGLIAGLSSGMWVIAAPIAKPAEFWGFGPSGMTVQAPTNGTTGTWEGKGIEDNWKILFPFFAPDAGLSIETGQAFAATLSSMRNMVIYGLVLGLPIPILLSFIFLHDLCKRQRKGELLAGVAAFLCIMVAALAIVNQRNAMFGKRTESFVATCKTKYWTSKWTEGLAMMEFAGWLSILCAVHALCRVVIFRKEEDAGYTPPTTSRSLQSNPMRKADAV
jgi:hypothetical protein